MGLIGLPRRHPVVRAFSRGCSLSLNVQGKRLMRISTRPQYALRLMLDICRHAEEDKPVHLREIATRNRLSKGYLEQLVVSLKNAQLIRSFSGRSGGYRLGKAPEEISVLEIIEAIIGPINVVECVQRPEECLMADVCDCRALWRLLNHRIVEVLSEYSLKDLCEKQGMKRISQALKQYKE